MAKLQDLFTQARRTQGGGGMGFLGKNRASSKAHAAALVVEFSQVSAGGAESVLKAGADGLLFTWNGQDGALLESIKKEIDSAKTSDSQIVAGLQITGGWDKLDRESINNLKDLGILYIILPFNAPARLLAMETKDVEKVVTIPVRTEDLYPIFIRNLSALDRIAAVLLDLELSGETGSLSIGDVLRYRAVREAVRFPAFVRVANDLDEAGAYTLNALGVQAVILTADAAEEKTRQEVKHLRELLEKVFQEDNDTPSIPK
ncbi:MAG TPA: hypothetical protein VFB60_13330 [Ktedonobacteraceae bacterium]|nr:hypothetical protein [Ktedonobacteraceae bacterium]